MEASRASSFELAHDRHLEVAVDFLLHFSLFWGWGIDPQSLVDLMTQARIQHLLEPLTTQVAVFEPRFHPASIPANCGIHSRRFAFKSLDASSLSCKTSQNFNHARLTRTSPSLLRNLIWINVSWVFLFWF
jgi:hypothetical protein